MSEIKEDVKCDKMFDMSIHSRSYFRSKSRCKSKKPIIAGNKGNLSFKEEFKRIMAKENKGKDNEVN